MKYNWTVTFEGLITGAIIKIDVIVDERRIPECQEPYKHAVTLAWAQINKFADPDSDEDFDIVGIQKGGALL